jgi:hypothetical protein
MNRKFWNGIAATLALLVSPWANAQWCDLSPGWQIVTHGTKSENTYILGRLQGGNDMWILIGTPTVGKTNVALALSAVMGGKNLSLYLDSPSYTCATFPSWAPAGEIRHVRLID